MLKEQEFCEHIAMALLLVLSGMSGLFEFRRRVLLLLFALTL
jgi:hypothetical protein